MTPRPVIYASSGWGVHDQRWTSALEACGFAVSVHLDGPDLRSEVEASLPEHAPVLAGPLIPVTARLIELDRRLVGLSWGFDLQEGHSRSVSREELSWLHQLDALIVDSPSSRILAIESGMNPEHIHLIPWGIDTEAFQPTGPQAELPFEGDCRVVLSLRTHDLLYRTADVLEAFAAAALIDPDLRMVMAGSGPLTPDHRARADELGLAHKLWFPGAVPEAQVAELLRSADVYVSAAETDGTSVTLLQAMSCRVPVIVSDTPGNSWWVDDGQTGRTFPVGDTSTLAELMVTASRDDASLDAAATLVNDRADWAVNLLALRDIMAGDDEPGT